MLTHNGRTVLVAPDRSTFYLEPEVSPEPQQHL